MTVDIVYEENVSSNRTEALFIILGLLFLILLTWRLSVVGIAISTIIFLCLFGCFLFYALNYRTLTIRITSEAVRLRFGVFTHIIPMRNIETCYPDQVSLWRLGGAGIHFTIIRRNYRSMFNFLEHERVVLSLRKKKCLVREVAFSTTQPEKIMRIITEHLIGPVNRDRHPVT